MNSKSLRNLEYNKIISILMQKAVSPMGKDKASRLKPSCDLGYIIKTQRETGEALALIMKRGTLPLGGLKDISQSLKRVEIGGVLSIEELLHIGDFLHVSKKVVAYSANDRDKLNTPILDDFFLRIYCSNSLEKEISHCIVNETQIADNASKALADTRQNIKTSNERIKEQLNNIIHSQSYKNMLQDAVITIRNDRYCVPVKQEYKGSFPGMVHDQSSTGATFFIEPMSVVQLNNKIKELLAQEKIEMEKVLKSLSLMVAEEAHLLCVNLDILTELDFIFAKGELSAHMNGTEPIFNNKGIVNIQKGRHPLLDPEKVVPTDIYLGDSFHTLLITGPNTGGKTVSLKTVGLFQLMGQAGLHISAFDNSELAVFEEVFVDIGDEQSIEQSLSTFSSHMTNIVNILQNVTDKSLVLLDELGAGTDPTEGAALGIAILKYLGGRQIRTAVTTHYSELKIYALSTANVENASCEFDVETLKPTYKLLIGIPGKSNAFAISQKLGLPEHIITSAKEGLSHEDTKLEDVIVNLEITKKSVLIEQERAMAYRKEAEKIKKDFDSQKQQLSLSKEKLLSEAKEQSRKILQQAKDEADLLMKELQKQINNSALGNAEGVRQKIRESLSSVEKDMAKNDKNKTPLRPAPKKLRIGDRVYVNSLNQTGIVTTLPDSSGDTMIQAGIMKMKVNIKDLSLDDKEETIKVNKMTISHNIKASKSLSISSEVDLRGLMVEEALSKTDKYLDDAYLSSMGQVTIIHGKGTGALRTAIHAYLKNHPHVKTYRLGVYGEGEAGVTIVELNKS